MSIRASSHFSWFFVEGLLRSMGWPRPSGLLRRPSVPALIVQSSIEMMTLTSAVLATVNPERGLNLLSATFQNRDWLTQPADDLLNELDPITKLSQPTEMGTPWGKLVAMAWQARSRTIPWSELATSSTGLVIALTCARALAWGLLHPASVRLAMADFSRLSAQAAVAGVDLGGYILDDFDSFAMKAEFALSAYEEQIGGRLRQAVDDLSRALAARTS